MKCLLTKISLINACLSRDSVSDMRNLNVHYAAGSTYDSTTYTRLIIYVADNSSAGRCIFIYTSKIN